MDTTPCAHPRWRLAHLLGPPQQECTLCYELRPFPPHKFRPKAIVGDLSGIPTYLCRDCGCDREAVVHGATTTPTP